MPELPEVEFTARQLRASLVGSTIKRATVFWNRTIGHPAPEDFCAEIAGRQVVGVRRRAKYLILDLSGDLLLSLHRRMTGNLLLLPPVWDIDSSLRERDRAAWDMRGPTFVIRPEFMAHLPERYHELVAKMEREARYCRFCLEFTDGYRLVYTDPRKFGRAELWPRAREAEAFRELGPEPLGADFTVQRLREAIAGRKSTIKQVLLAQEVVAGLGNIYADEALYYASIHPLRRPASLSGAEMSRLHEGIVAVLTLGIEHGGTSFSDYHDLWGEGGDNYDHVRVYHHDGDPCQRCGTAIERIVIGQRAAYFCPRCQRLSEA